MKIFFKNNILSICSIIIALCALFATIYQSYIQRDHNRRSVVPLLSIKMMNSFDADKGKEYYISIVNNGFGPAIIYAIDVKVKDKFKVYTKGLDWNEILTTLENETGYKINNPNKLGLVSFGKSHTLAVGGEIKVIQIKSINQNESTIKDFMNIFNNISFGICHHSIYGDRFMIKSYDEIIDKSCRYVDSYKINGEFYHFKFPWEEKKYIDKIY